MITKRKKRSKFAKATEQRPKTQSEINERIRSLSYSDALTAVEWLNAAKGTAAYKRVIKVHRDLDELANIFDALQQRWQVRKDTRPRTEQEIIKHEQESAQLEISFRERHNNLNQLLAKYTFVPALDYHIPSATWRFDTVPKVGSGPYVDIKDGAIIVRAMESSVITAMARLTTKRELYKVRLCVQCGERWRVSDRQIDRFCSEACRVAWYQSKNRRRLADHQAAYRERLKQAKSRGLA